MGYINKLKSKEGQQMVEMAIVLPVILLCIGILISAGQLFFAKMTCQMAAYEGARQAVVMDNRNSAKQTAINTSKRIMKNGIGVEGDSYSFNASSWNKGNHLTYTVSTNVKTLFPLISSNLEPYPSTPVKGNIVMMIERD